jgi:hypothetical protein
MKTKIVNYHMHWALKQKVDLLGIVPFLLHLIEKLNCFLGCPTLKIIINLLFHEKMFNCTLFGAITTIFTSTHEGVS